MKYYRLFLLVYYFWWCFTFSGSRKVIRKPPTPAAWDATRIVDKMCRIYSYHGFNYTIKESTLIESSTRTIDRKPNCNMVQPLVYGGREVEETEYPHMAAIGYKSSLKNAVWECSGSLISEQFVLSAAHCVTNEHHGPAKWIKLGDLDLHNSTDDANSKSYKITGCYPHPKYKKGTNYSDIALFKFSGLVEFNVFIKPLCLSTSGNQIKPGEKPIVTGYGYKEEPTTTLLPETKIKGRLRVASIQIMEKESCILGYNKANTSENQTRAIGSMEWICAGDMEKKNDTCEGDSGGPLQFQDLSKCNYIQIGITSTGPLGCLPPMSPATYTNVTHFIRWIQEIVWPNEPGSVFAYLG